MPIVNIVPTTPLVEVHYSLRMGEIRQRMKEDICRISGFPPTDVVVNLLKCPYKDPDLEAAADAIVYVDTCPHKELEKRADELRIALAQVLVDLGLASGRMVEVWVRFFLPGSWGLWEDGKEVDSVSHQR